MKLHIQGGRLLLPSNTASSGVAAADGTIRADLYAADGRIVAIGAAPEGFDADRTLDAAGWVVAPGAIDLCARFPTRGAGLARELEAAVAGGITTVVCAPDLDPLLDSVDSVEMLRLRARRDGAPSLHPLGALTQGLAGQTLAEMTRLAEAGCIGFSQGEAALADTQVLLNALSYAASQGHALWLRAQDPHLARGAVAASGAVAARLGLPGIPALAESIALQTLLALVRETGARLHVQQISSADGVALLRAAKREGLPVSGDVDMHHLHLIDTDIGFFDSHYKLMPPLRGHRDRDALRAGLLDGTLDAICSGHRPLAEERKHLPFGEATAGATGFELLLALTVKWAQDARVPLARALARITAGPAAVLGGPGASLGRIEVGAAADLCLFDPEAYWTVDPAALLSAGRATPLAGYELPAPVQATVIGGAVAFERTRAAS
jgi:dihydroorotase